MPMLAVTTAGGRLVGARALRAGTSTIFVERYIGGNAGWGWSNGSGSFTLAGPTIAGMPDSFFASGNGFLGGAQIGGNYQWDGFVFGLEVDFQAIDRNRHP